MTAIRRTIALLLVLFTGCFSPVTASGDPFSPAWEEMTEAYLLRREPIHIALSAQCGALPLISPDALEHLNAWLEGSSLLLESRIRDETVTEEHVKGDFDGESFLDCWIREEQGQTLAVFDRERGYLTDPGLNALRAAAGLDTFFLPDSRRAEILFRQILPMLYEHLEYNGAAVTFETGTVRLSPAENSPYQSRYVLERDQINLLWHDLRLLLQNGLRNLLNVPEALCREADGLLAGCEFSSGMTLLRLFDRQGLDMGVRISGRVRPGDGSTRKVDLTAAYTEGKGVLLDLNLPASSGRYSDRWILKITRAERLLTADGSVSRKDPSGSVSLKLKGQFQNDLDTQEHLTGEATLDGKVYGVEKNASLSADLVLKPGYGDGILSLSGSTAEDSDYSVTVYLQLGMGQMGSMPECQTLEDLRGASPKQMERTLSAEATGLAYALLKRFSSLAYPEWAAIVHGFANALWLDGGVVETNTKTEYTVEGTDSEWSVN